VDHGILEDDAAIIGCGLAPCGDIRATFHAPTIVFSSHVLDRRAQLSRSDW
jgi:hypothetical protein